MVYSNRGKWYGITASDVGRASTWNSSAETAALLPFLFLPVVRSMSIVSGSNPSSDSPSLFALELEIKMVSSSSSVISTILDELSNDTFFDALLVAIAVNLLQKNFSPIAYFPLLPPFHGQLPTIFGEKWRWLLFIRKKRIRRVLSAQLMLSLFQYVQVSQLAI